MNYVLKRCSVAINQQDILYALSAINFRYNILLATRELISLKPRLMSRFVFHLDRIVDAAVHRSSTTSLFKFINVQAMKTFQKATRSLNSCKGARFMHRGWELFNLISLFHLYKCFWNTQLSNFKSIKSSQLGSLVRNRKRFTGPQFIPSYPPSVRKLQKF